MLRRGEDPGAPDTVAAALALARCGLSLLKAKRTVEKAVEDGEATAILPLVASKAGLVEALRTAGFDARIVTPDDAFSVRALRERLGLTQEQFSVIYGVDLRTLQKYERGERTPDGTALAYFRVIERGPQVVRRLRTEASPAVEASE